MTSPKFSTTPTVLHPISLSAFLLHILHHHNPPTTLIICSSRQDFFSQLLASIQKDATSSSTNVSFPVEQTIASSSYQSHPLLLRTLHLISASQTINVAFVRSVSALHAYLSALPARLLARQHAVSTTITAAPPTLAIFGILQLHRSSLNYSAQGLARAFAAAVETSYECGQRLIFGESNSATASLNFTVGGHGEDIASAEENIEMPSACEVNSGIELHEQRSVGAEWRCNNNDSESGEMNCWDDEVPVLDASTKTFGLMGGERAWLGRSVRIKDIVGRWCVFEQLAPHERGMQE